MNKSYLVVPKGIRYISDWKEYTLENFQFPHILNKTITGCGYTEYCINNNLNIILCSPRKILLENKEDQHNDVEHNITNVYYVRNELEKTVNYEKDLTVANPKLPKEEVLALSENEIKARIMKLKDGVKDYWNSCQPSPFNSGKPCKILVTYDSFRHVKEALGKDIEKFYIIIDEFQSIFTDAKFKSSTELEFVTQVQGLQKVCLVSATPMLEKYLDMLDEFKSLPYFEMDWNKESPGRVIIPNLNVKYCGKRNTIQAEIRKVVEKYRAGLFESYKFRDNCGNLREIQSKEAVIYVNSVKDITKAIKYNNLTFDQCNILCARTPKNEQLIQKAFGLKKKEGPFIGKVPKRGEKHKMFTFCTRTVYLGADFYSTNARSFIFSNANIDCLSVDISMDLPQILGRQRLEENPWKNSADLYITLRYEGEKTKKAFNDYMADKIKATESLLRSYGIILEEDKQTLAFKYEKDAKATNYRDDYVAVNHHAGSSMLPVFNNLMLVSEIRTFEVQEIDYKDRFSVFNSLSQFNIHTEKEKLDKILYKFNNNFSEFTERLKYVCELKSSLEENEFNALMNLIPMDYKNYIVTLGIPRCSANSYNRSKLEKEFRLISSNQEVKSLLNQKIFDAFEIGKRYSKSDVKTIIGNIYANINYKKAAKANDLENWFEIRDVLLTINSKRIAGYEIIKKK